MYSFFVSSTFKDMHFERDVINCRITPKINFRLQEFNQSVRVIDLRWGIDTSNMSEKDASDKVMAVCYNAIESCKPFFIVLIGDRYGYIPQGSDISITHKEIIRGIIENTDHSHVYIYIRDADYSDMPADFQKDYFDSDEIGENRLKELKDTLKDKFQAQCKTYHAKWSQEKQCLVSDDFEDMIRLDLESDLVALNAGVSFKSELHKQIYENDCILAETVCDVYLNKVKLDLDVRQILENNVPYGVLGATGSGKSIYLSLLCTELKAAGKDAHIIYCGNSIFSSSTRNIAEYILYLFIMSAQKNYPFEKGATLSYQDIISRILSVKDLVAKKQYLFLDAADQCDANIESFIRWCESSLFEQMKIIYSGTADGEIRMAPDRQSSISVIKYERNDFKAMVELELHKHQKTLPDDLVELMLKKAQTPLQLNLMLTRFFNLNSSDYEAIQNLGGGAEAINAYLKQSIKDSPDNIISAISVYIDDYFQNCKRDEFVFLLLLVLSVLPFGLPEDDIRAILKDQIDWVEIEYLEFLESLSAIVHVGKNGMVCIPHVIVRAWIRTAFSEAQNDVCCLVAEYYLHLPKQTVFTVKTIFTVTIQANLKKELFAFLVSKRLVFSSGKPDDVLVAEEIRRTILNLFFTDKGVFLFSIFSEGCTKADDALFFQGVLMSAFVSAPDFIDENSILDLAHAMMVLPVNLPFPDDQIKLIMNHCVRFLKQKYVSQAKLDEFIHEFEEYYDQERDIVDKKREQLKNTNEIELLDAIDFLIEKAKELTTNRETAQQAKEILDELSEAQKSNASLFNNEQQRYLERRIFSISAMAYKALGDCEHALECDKKALEISRELYREQPSKPYFNQYRTQLYNVVNILEAQAISKQDDKDLWAQVDDLWKDVYECDSTLVSQDYTDANVIEMAYDLVSWGNASLRIGNIEAGTLRCIEGVELIKKQEKDDWPIHLCSSIYQKVIEPVFLLCFYGDIDSVEKVAPVVLDILKKVMASKDPDAIKTVSGTGLKLIAIEQSILDPLKGNVDRILCAHQWIFKYLYELLPVANYPLKYCLLIAKYTAADILFALKREYEKAYDSFQELLELAVERMLAVPENGEEMSEESIKFLSEILLTTYVKIICCTIELKRDDAKDQLIRNSDKFAKYVTEFILHDPDDWKRFLSDVAVYLIGFKQVEAGNAILLVIKDAMENKD